MTRRVESHRRRRYRRARIVAAITGFGMLGLSLFGLGIAAYAAPPAPAATPSILTPLNNSMTADTTPDVQVFVFTDTDSSVQIYADGNPYCLMTPTGVGPYNNSCAGAPLSFGPHTFTAVTDYLAPFNGNPSAPSTAVNITIYDDSGPTLVPPPSPTIDTTPSFSGTGPLGGQIVRVYEMTGNTDLCLNIPVQPDGTWSCTSIAALAPAAYSIRAVSQDAGGGGTFTTQVIGIVPPSAALVDDTFGPGWRTGFQPSVQGDKSIGASEVVVEVSSDGGGSWGTYCTVNASSDAPISNDATVWFCNTPNGPAQLLPGDNLLRATEYNDAGTGGPAGPTITITLVADLPTIIAPADNYVTNDPAPLFEGTVDPGVTSVTVYEYPGDSTTFCFDPGPIVGGEWDCTPGAPIPDGTYQYWAVAGPGQGLSTDPRTITIDTLAPPFPTITDPPDPTSTTNQHPIISGTAEPNTFVQPMVDGSPDNCIGFPGLYPVDGAGNWSCELLTPLTVGPHNIAAAGVDEAGNTLGTSGTQLVLTVEPALASIDATFSPWYTSSDFVQVQGNNSDEPVQVWIERNDNPGPIGWTPYCSVDYDAPQSGLTVWFCDESSSPGQQGTLELGSNYLRARVMVGGGQMSAWSAPILITQVEPTAVLSPTNGAILTDSTPTLSGSAPTESNFVDVELSGETGTLCSNVPVDVDGLWSCTSAPMSDGPHSFFALTTDLGGIGGAVTTVTIDTTPPPFPVIDTPPNYTVTAATTQTIGGSAQPGSTVTVWMNGEPMSCGTGSFQPNASGRWACVVGPLAFDTYEVAASASDSLGNSTGPSATQLFLTIDPFKPTTLMVLTWTLGSWADKYYPGDTVAITGSGLPMGATANAEIHSTPQWVGSAITDASGEFTIDAVIPEDIEPGLHTFVVTVTADGAEPSILEQPVMIEAVPVPPKALAEQIEKNGSGGGYDDWQSLGDRNDPATPSVLTSSLDTIAQILGNPVFIATAGGVGLALLLFVAIPAELLNATLSEQYDRITKRMPRSKAGWWARFKGWLAGTPILGGTALTLLAAIIFGFADPGFGFDLTSLRIVLALAIGLFVVGFLASAVTGAVVGRRWGLRTVIEIQPLGIILAVVGVLISRLLDFSPGILIGLLIGIALVGKVTKADEGRTAIVKAAVVWVFSVLAWGLYSILSGPLTGSSFAGNLTVETMVAITAEGLTALLIGLLPFKFLEGSAIWNHNKILWAAIWLAAAASWVLIVLPQNFGAIQGSLWIWGVVVGAFAVVALAVYFIFRFAVKAPPEDEDESESETQKVRLGRGR